MLAGASAFPAAALADDALEDLKAQQAIAEAKVAILKAQREQAKLEATAGQDKIDALKNLVEAQVAIEKGQTATELSTVTALKELLGAPKPIGEGGAVTPGNKDIPFLLWSSMGDLPLIQQAAEAMCNATAPLTMLFAPIDLTARRQALIGFDVQARLLREASLKMLGDLGAGQQKSFSAAAAIGLATTGLYAAGAVSELVKSLRTDRAITLHSASRADAFERVVMGNANCAHIERIDWKTAVLDKVAAQFEAKNKTLHTLREAYGKWCAWKAQAETGLKKAEDKQSAGKSRTKADAAAATDMQARLDKVLAYAWLADSLKQFLDGASADAVMKLAETAALVEHMDGKAGLSYTLIVNNLQINASGAFGKGLRRIPMVELQYTVTDTAGEIKKTGIFAKKGREQVINWEQETP